MAAATSYDSVEELLETRANESVHLECPRETIDRAVRFVHERYARRRCAFYLITDRGFDRETVRSYLKFFARLAGGSPSLRLGLVSGPLRGPLPALAPVQAPLLGGSALLVTRRWRECRPGGRWCTPRRPP